MYTKFQDSSLSCSEKTVTQILNVNMQITETNKKMKIEEKRTMSLSLNPTKQSPIMHMYAMLKTKCARFWRKMWHKYSLKSKKMNK